MVWVWFPWWFEKNVFNDMQHLMLFMRELFYIAQYCSLTKIIFPGSISVILQTNGDLHKLKQTKCVNSVMREAFFIVLSEDYLKCFML